MTFNYRSATHEDYPAVLGLIKELALFEKAPEKVTNTVDQMIAEDKYFETLVACDDNDVIGMAIYCYNYSTWVGKALYLEDLYVQDAYRGQGIGKELINRVLEVARGEKCSRVRWQVLDWNESAIGVYEKMGAELDNGWINCTLEGENI